MEGPGEHLEGQIKVQAPPALQHSQAGDPACDKDAAPGIGRWVNSRGRVLGLGMELCLSSMNKAWGSRPPVPYKPVWWYTPAI